VAQFEALVVRQKQMVSARSDMSFLGATGFSDHFRGVTLFSTDGMRVAIGECRPFNVNLPVFTPGREQGA